MASITANRADERLKETPLLTRLLSRPELGAIAGTVLVFAFFAVVAAAAGCSASRA